MYLFVYFVICNVNKNLINNNQKILILIILIKQNQIFFQFSNYFFIKNISIITFHLTSRRSTPVSPNSMLRRVNLNILIAPNI